MNTKQDAKLAMYRTVEKQCDENPAIVGSVPAFQNAVALFKSKIAEIIAAVRLSDVQLSGVAVDKTARKQNLAAKAADIAGIIFAFASATKNPILKQEVRFNLSKLLKTRDDLLAPRCQNIHDKGHENRAALGDYGIEAEHLAELQTLIDDYSAVTPKTRTAVSQRKVLNANLRQLFKDADEILKEQMDKLVVNFRSSHPDFVAQYESNRIIIDPSRTTTELRGIVTQIPDNSPLKNAVVTIVETGTSAVTDSQGAYSIKPAPVGRFTIKASAAGFQNLERDETDIKLGEINRLDFAFV